MGISVFQGFCRCIISIGLLSLSVGGNRNGSDLHCVSSIKVSRSSTFRASVGAVLHINCPVFIDLSKCQKRPNVVWCKIYREHCEALNISNYIKIEWKDSTDHERTSTLIFLNLSMGDAGIYRCKTEISVGHNINVTVSDLKQHKASHNLSDAENTGSEEDQLWPWIWPYFYIAIGTVALLITVVAITLLIIKSQCVRSFRTTTNITNKIQYMETQKRDLPSPRLHYNSPEQPSSSPCISESPVIHTCHKTPVDEIVVYVSLNHQPVARGPRRKVKEELTTSEYAAIKFK